MRVLAWLHLVQLVLASLLAADLLNEAKIALEKLPPKYLVATPVYSLDNIYGGMYIPQYNAETHQYEGYQQVEPPAELINEILPNLDAASQAGLQEASVMLGDIYMFGNYSVEANYTKALEYYTASVAELANGHAYFMMGFLYSTGMFGEIPVDKEKANVYYEYAAQNDDLNALLVLANNHLHGIGRPQNCQTAQFYYARLARWCIKYLHETGAEPSYDSSSFNIKLPDFNGGIYGKHVTESEMSVVSKIDSVASFRNDFRERNINTHDSEIAENYFDAVTYYYGGYFTKRDPKKAFEHALLCAYRGDEKFSNKNLASISRYDRYFWSRCSNLLGHMYLKGHGVERDLSRAHDWMERTRNIYTTERDMLDMALLHQYDPTTDKTLSPQCQSWLNSAAYNGSTQGAYLYARYLIGSTTNPFDTTYESHSYELLRSCVRRDHYESMFYLADAVECGYVASVGESFTCTDLVSYYKRFVEKSESFLLPHLKYAFDELLYGNYKGALLGYLIAAEQGLANAQISASFLLYQLEPIFTWTPRTFEPSRVKSAMNYLELASLQGNVDASILLGDLYSGSQPSANITKDNAKAFAYYNKAALSFSPHGCYKLGYMYEYGMGSANNTVDYYMAKRYYDLSIKYRQDYNSLDDSMKLSGQTANTYPVSIALLRLRLKVLWSRDKKQQQLESSGWFGTFKSLGREQEIEDEDERIISRAQQHHEGGDIEEEEDYDMFDYVVLIFTFAFFAYMFFQNIRRQIRRGRGGGGVENNANEANNGDDLGVRIQGRNFEFFFFAI